MAKGDPRGREKRIFSGRMRLCQNSTSGQVIMTIPKRIREHSEIPAGPGDELKVVEVVDKQTGETRIELHPVE